MVTVFCLGQRGRSCPAFCRTESCVGTCANSRPSAGSSRASARSATGPCSQVRRRSLAPERGCRSPDPASSTPVPECPSVRELHVELDEVSQLLDVSKDQYEEILSVVQRHTQETANWLSSMAAEFGWVGQTPSDSSTGPESVFVVTKVKRGQRGGRRPKRYV